MVRGQVNPIISIITDNNNSNHNDNDDDQLMFGRYLLKTKRFGNTISPQSSFNFVLTSESLPLFRGIVSKFQFHMNSSN